MLPIGYFLVFNIHGRDFLGNAVLVLWSENRCDFTCVNTSACISMWLCVSIYNKCLAVGGPTLAAPHLSVWIDACMRDVSVTPRVSVQVGVDEYTLCR